MLQNIQDETHDNEPEEIVESEIRDIVKDQDSTFFFGLGIYFLLAIGAIIKYFDHWVLMTILLSPFLFFIPYILISHYRYQSKNHRVKWIFHEDYMMVLQENGKVLHNIKYTDIRNWDERKRKGTYTDKFDKKPDYTELVFWTYEDLHLGFGEDTFANYTQMAGKFMEKMFEIGKSEIR